MAHRLIAGTSEKCAVPHGHNEVVTIELRPALPFRLGNENALAPFERLKGRWHAWIDGAVDHSFQLNAKDPLLGYFTAHEPQRLARIMTFPGDPTTEAQAILFFLKLEAFLAEDQAPFAPSKLSIAETPTNAVEVDAAFVRSVSVREGWWTRPDFSINDLNPHPAPFALGDALVQKNQ